VFDDVASATVRSALAGLAARQRVSANNIANIGTPGFTAGRVAFEDALRSAVADGSVVDGQVGPTEFVSPLAARQDGNNVNLDEETLSSMDTGLRYRLMLRVMDDQYNLVSAAVKGAR
jgi:flagellar basal-body rod protein FlgB